MLRLLQVLKKTKSWRTFIFVSQ